MTAAGLRGHDRTVCVAVIGPGEGARPQDVAAAGEIGRLLAAAGAVVITGGLGGVMSAATAGAGAAGGVTLALLPGPTRAGSDATVVVPTGLGEARNVLVVSSADAVVAVGGSWGTLSEIALARRSGVPVVCLAGWSITDADGGDLTPPTASSPHEAVARVLALAGVPSGTMER